MEQQLIDKQRIANSFSNAAETYDSLAELQREVGSHLMDHLPEQQPEELLDLGCGTGYFTPFLKKKYPQAYLYNLDLALGMLRYARENRPAECSSWFCADAENLPLADKSIGLIYSSLAIQWCEDLKQLFSEIQRVLKPGGKFVFATLGPETLSELKTAWAAADTHIHVNRFVDQQELQNHICESLKLQSFEEEFKVLKYQELKGLTDELKGIGAHNMNSGQPTGLVGRERLRRFKAGYEEQRLTDGMLPATYQVFYVVVEKPLEN